MRQLRVAFADSAHFAVHDAVPACFGDEGAANHMRMGIRHDAPGLELFVYGKAGGAFPARQHEQAMMSQSFTHHWDEIEYFELAVPHAAREPKVAGVKAGCNGCHGTESTHGALPICTPPTMMGER